VSGVQINTISMILCHTEQSHIQKLTAPTKRGGQVSEQNQT
jgi:hypothetical protein